MKASLASRTTPAPSRSRSAVMTSAPPRSRQAGEEDAVGAGARNLVGERGVARRARLPASCSREAEPELARGGLEPRLEHPRVRVPGKAVEEVDALQPQPAREEGGSHALDLVVRDDAEVVPHPGRIEAPGFIGPQVRSGFACQARVCVRGADHRHGAAGRPVRDRKFPLSAARVVRADDGDDLLCRPIRPARSPRT